MEKRAKGGRRGERVRGPTQPKAHDAGAAELLERVSDAFVALDRNWRYTHVKSQAGALFNRKPEDLLGKHLD